MQIPSYSHVGFMGLRHDYWTPMTQIINIVSHFVQFDLFTGDSEHILF